MQEASRVGKCEFQTLAGGLCKNKATHTRTASFTRIAHAVCGPHKGKSSKSMGIEVKSLKKEQG